MKFQLRSSSSGFGVAVHQRVRDLSVLQVDGSAVAAAAQRYLQRRLNHKRFRTLELRSQV